MTLDLETWFRVTAHPLPKGCAGELWVRLGIGERRYAPQTSYLARTDEQTDERTNRLITIGRPQSGSPIIYVMHILYC